MKFYEFKLSGQWWHMPQARGIYLIEDSKKKVNYVGATDNLLKRIWDHRKPSRGIATENDTVCFIHLGKDSSKETLSEMEQLLIRILKPKLNILKGGIGLTKTKIDPHFYHGKLERCNTPELVPAFDKFRKKMKMTSHFMEYDSEGFFKKCKCKRLFRREWMKYVK